jgi:hypothetical protein
MIVLNDGGPCEISRRFKGAPATSIIVHEQPKNGVLAVEAPAVRYTPNANFTGKDFFEASWFGMARGPYSPIKSNIRARVEVTVVGPQLERKPAQ